MQKGGKLCATIAASDVKTLVGEARRALADGVDLVELRLDYLHGAAEEEMVKEISAISESCIVTVRSRAEGGRFRGGERERLQRLLAVSKVGPHYIDVELATAEKDHRLAHELARNSGGLIVSWHGMEGTPARRELANLRDRAMKVGDIAKVVATARRLEDNGRIISLYDGKKAKGRLIAFCTGEKGMISRVVSMMAGSPISYVTVAPNPVAAGQLPFRLVKELLGSIVR